MKKIIRKNSIDFLKGIAIIAVVLYHMGLLESGYLGVDVFFVIAGFLTIPSIFRKLDDGSFSYWTYIKNKIIRFLPMILIASVLCLIVGLFLWLPDDYENLSESVIASTFFSNNILSGIISKNYWDVANDFKPLMHMWYLGILMEFYIVAPLLMKVFRFIAIKTKRTAKRIVGGALGVLCIISLLLFVLPQFNTGDKFYFIPFRFYELAIGGFIGLFLHEIIAWKWTKSKRLLWISIILLVALRCIGLFSFDVNSIGAKTTIIGENQAAEHLLLLPNTILVLLTVLLTGLALILSDGTECFRNKNVICLIGKRSYSIFVWHQVLLALYRYSISTTVTILFIAGYVVAVTLISEISYRLIEQKVMDTRKNMSVTIASAIIICSISGLIYLNAGVVRDIPELGITTENAHRNMHAEYCDRIYHYDVDFPENGKLNVLVIGNSFARDFGNIVLESGIDVNLSYIYSVDKTYIDRIKSADKVFIFSDKNKVPDYVWENCKTVYGIGTKNFGQNNGQIYAKRYSSGYFEQTINYDEGYRNLNNKWKMQWELYYVDMMMPVTTTEGEIRIFTDDNMYISQDCRHLTKAGAKYYAKLLDLETYLN